MPLKDDAPGQTEGTLDAGLRMVYQDLDVRLCRLSGLAWLAETATAGLHWAFVVPTILTGVAIVSAVFGFWLLGKPTRLGARISIIASVGCILAGAWFRAGPTTGFDLSNVFLTGFAALAGILSWAALRMGPASRPTQ